MTDNDLITVFTGYFTLGADDSDIEAIRDALQKCGYAVDIDREDGAITVQHDQEQARQELAEKARTAKQGDGDYEPLDADEEDSDISERSDEDDEEDKALTKREQRIQRLQDGIEDGEAYTSDELCAIDYDIDAAEVGTSERAYLSNLRANGDIDLQTMPDPNRHGNAKLYYQGEQPDVEEQNDTADCRYCGEEYTKRGVRRHERCCDDNPDVETAWTVKQVEAVMHGSGWMTTKEIAQGVLDKDDVSYDERDRFHDLLSRKPDLEARVTSRPDPADQRRNQYRLIDDTDAADSDESAESESECGCPTNAAGEVQHDGDCPHGVEQEIEEMQEDLYQEDDPADPDLPDPDADSESATTDTGDADDEELIEEMGPCNLGKIMVEGVFDQYVCQECGRPFDEESAADTHADDANHPTFKAFDQVPE